jgi:hypothetical protein
MMNTSDLDRAAITIHRTDVFRLAAARGRRIESVLGRVWITIDGDPRDIVLDVGEGFSVDRDSGVMISALRGDARFVLLDAIAAH